MAIACPKCKAYMFPAREKQVNIDSCSGCQGVWLDRGELGQLTGCGQDFPEPASPVPTALSCPRCGDSLASRSYSAAQPLQVECCSRCQGIYLDKGELSKLEQLSTRVNSSFPPAYQAKMAKKAEWKEALSALYKTGDPVSKISSQSRQQFIAQVYQLLAATLVVTGLGAAVGMSLDMGQDTFVMAAVGEIVAFLICLFVRRMPPFNLIALCIYTALSGLTLSVVLRQYEMAGMGGLLWEAAGLTGLIFGGLSVYVHRTGEDFSFLGGFLYSGLMVLIGVIFANFFMGSELVDALSAGAGVLVFIGFILYDTSNVLLKYEHDEVVSAVLELYLDIINLFLDLLRVLAYTQRK